MIDSSAAVAAATMRPRLSKRAYTADLARSKLYEMMKDGTLKSIKIRARRLILADSPDALLQAGQVDA